MGRRFSCFFGVSTSGCASLFAFLADSRFRQKRNNFHLVPGLSEHSDIDSVTITPRPGRLQLESFLTSDQWLTKTICPQPALGMKLGHRFFERLWA